MRSQLYYLCLLAVYAAASPLHKILPETPAVPKANIILRKDGRMHGQPAKRATTSTKGDVQLASSRGMESSVDGCDDEHETTSSSRSVTVKVVPVTATKTKTVDVTAVTTTSRTNTKYSTSTATKTVTKNVQLGVTPPITTSKTTSKPTTTSKQSTTKVSAPATTTLSTLVTPIPTSSSYVFAGMASYFYTGLGACGWWSADTDMVVALPDHVYDNYPGATPWWDTNGNPVCGKQILATWGTQTIQVTVVDRCVGCETYQLGKWFTSSLEQVDLLIIWVTIDMSPTAFAALTDGNLDMGLARGLTWRWL